MYRRFVTALGPVLFAMFLMIPPTMGQQVQGGIVWYGVLADGLAEAERTGKPILLISAAPQCVGVSGMW